MSKLGLAGSALLATAGGATTLASGLTITAHASEKPQTNTQTNQADKLKKASNQLDTASKQQAKMINALLESKVDAQVPTQPGTYTKSVALLDASGKQLGTATLTRVVNADGSSQSSLSKDIPAGYTLKDVSVLNHYPSAVTLTRVAGATQAGTTTKAIKLTDASGKLIATGTATRVVDEKGASTVSVKGIPQGYRVANIDSLSTFPDQLVIEKGEPINNQTAQDTSSKQPVNTLNKGEKDSSLTTGGQSQPAGTTTAGQGSQQTGNTTSGTTTGNTGSQSGQAQQGGTTTDNGTSATDSATNAQSVPVSDAVKDALAHHISLSDGVATPIPKKPVEKPATMVNTANATNSNQANTTDSNTNTGADTNKGQQTSDASKDSSKTSTDSKTTTDQGKTDTKKDDSKTSTSTTDSAKKDDTKKDDSKASTDEKKDEAKKDDSKSGTSKTDASKTTDNSKTNDTNSKVDNAIKGIDSVAKSSTDATKSVDNKSSDTGKKDDSKKSDSSKSDDKKSDDKKSDKKDGKLDLSDTTNALKKSSKDDDKKDSSAKKSDSDDSSKKDNVSNLLNKSANKSSNASDNAKVADANVSDNLSGKDGSTKKGITSSSTNATLPETGNTQSTAGILAGSAMVATMTALGIGVAHRKRS